MGVVYTAIFSPYDDLKEPRVITPDWRYVVFTDQDLKSDVWEVRRMPLLHEGPQRMARYYKINGFQEFGDEKTIWVDGSFIINCDLDKWWSRVRGPLTVIEHPERICFYQEANECLRQGRGNAEEIRRQYKDYQIQGLPRENGLISTGIIMRHNLPSVRNFCDKWWEQLEAYSVRDQLSFAHTAWKYPNAFQSIRWDYRTAKEFLHIPHLGNPRRFKRLMALGLI